MKTFQSQRLKYGKSQGIYLKDNMESNLNIKVRILVQKDGAPIRFKKMHRTLLEQDSMGMFIKLKINNHYKFMLLSSLKYQRIA
jgi:hypothetical protein